MVVHRGIFFNEEVACWNVGLRLIEVVVGNEILHCVFRKEVAHLGIGLRGQRLIGRKDDGRYTLTGNDVGHREGFARPGHAEKRLIHQTVFNACAERINRGRLVAGRREWSMKHKRRIGVGVSRH